MKRSIETKTQPPGSLQGLVKRRQFCVCVARCKGQKNLPEGWACEIAARKKEEAFKAALRGENRRKCKGCGIPIHPSCDYCGECLCEEDGL